MKELPRSNARTSLELLRDVQKALAEEPKRANIQKFVSRQSPEENGPACGTVGCVAGWIGILTNQRESMIDGDLAEHILGPGKYYCIGNGAEDNDGFYVFNSGAGDLCRWTQPGTQEHADAVIARIERLIELNPHFNTQEISL